MESSTLACIIFTVLGLFLIYVIYKLMLYQNNKPIYIEGFTGNCDVNTTKSNIESIKNKISQAVNVTDSASKQSVEDIITDAYDVVNYSILLQLCTISKTETGLEDSSNLMKLNYKMQVSQGLQRLMTWLDGKSSSSSGSSMFG